MVHTNLNLTKRKVILVILNTLVSTLLISSVVLLYYLLSTNSTNASNSSNSDIKTFTLDKESSNFMKILSKKYFHDLTNNNNINNNLNNNYNYNTNNYENNKINRNVVVHNKEALDGGINQLQNPDPSNSNTKTSNINNNKNNNNNNNDDTIYIDSYSEESYENLENQEIDHTINSNEPIKKPIYPSNSKSPTVTSDMDDFDYDNEDDYGYDDLDNDLVSSGNGKIDVDIKSIVKPSAQGAFKQNKIRAMNDQNNDDNDDDDDDGGDEEDYKVEAVASEDTLKKPENVYSVSSEILISHVITQNEKQINQNKDQEQTSESDENKSKVAGSSDDEEISEDDDDDDFGDDWSGTETDGIESRRRGNVRKSQEKSRQLLLCETAGTGELCRMLFKGSFG